MTTEKKAGKRSLYDQQEGQQQAARVRAEENHDMACIGKSPGEVAFFKMLHAELKKAEHFFDQATDEYLIREKRVKGGLGIMKQQNTLKANEMWRFQSQSINRLYKDLLLLETFGIMTYCGFSKILKKHDKVTGYSTRNKFMEGMVNNASFTHYPRVMGMISRCESLYDEVSDILLREGKKSLSEDERLFISMIRRLNDQMLESDHSTVHIQRTEIPCRPASNAAIFDNNSQACRLRALVEENENKLPAVPVTASTRVLEKTCAKKENSRNKAKPPAYKRARFE
jgi:hypothetical protein